MANPVGFPTWRNYFQFCLARDHITLDGEEFFVYEKNLLERIGQVVSRLVIEPLHFVGKNIRNPLFVATLISSALFLTTLAFYPAKVFPIIEKCLPFTKRINLAGIRMGVFIAMQVTISGIGLRAIGRLSNPELRRAWDAQEIAALQIGYELR